MDFITTKTFNLKYSWCLRQSPYGNIGHHPSHVTITCFSIFLAPTGALSQHSLRPLSGFSQLSPSSLSALFSAFSQPSLSELRGYFISQSEPKILRLVFIVLRFSFILRKDIIDHLFKMYRNILSLVLMPDPTLALLLCPSFQKLKCLL